MNNRNIVAVVGIVIAVLSIAAYFTNIPILILTGVAPLILCILLMITKKEAFGIAYVVVFACSRIQMFLTGTLLADAIVIAYLAWWIVVLINTHTKKTPSGETIPPAAIYDHDDAMTQMLIDRLEQQKKENENEACANDGRRFLLLVEDVFQLKDNQGIVVAGTIHGTIHVNDAVYILHPGKAITLAEITGIEVAQGQLAEQATDQPIGIRISDIKDKSEIAKYSVLTSIRPQTQIDVNTAVENPYILGMSLEYPRFSKDQEYLNLLIYEIAHGHYLAPMYLNKEPEKKEDGTSVFTEGTTMGFVSIKDPQDNTKNIFPVFTDWDALSRWKDVFDENHQPKTMILQFPDCVSITKNGHTGMVINPYGPNSIYIPMNLIDSVVNSDGYKREFEQQSESHVKKVKVEKETQIMVGLPAETSEVKLIKENLILFGKAHNEILRIDLLLKIDERNEKTYLCVVDCPEEKATTFFSAIYQAVGAYAQETKIIDFVLYRRADFVRDVLEKNAPVYEKK